MGSNTIGRHMRIARAMKNPPMQQKELLGHLQTAGLDISQSTLSKIENGDRTVSAEDAKIIADVLKVDLLWLITEDDSN